MSSSSGYNCVSNGLIFSYDFNNTKKSWLGAPCTNSQWNSGSEFGPWTVGGINTDVTGTSEAGPVAGAKTYRMQKTGTSSQWNGWEGTYGNIWTGSSGDVWTMSYWYKTTAPAGNTGFGIGSYVNSNWTYTYNTTILANVSSIIADGEWHFNYTVVRFNEAYGPAICADGPSWGYSTSAGTLWINGLQWNKNAYATQFAQGNRVLNQGIKDIAAGVTIDGNLTYDYTGRPYFNGPTSFDYLYATESWSDRPGNSFSYEAWFKQIDDNGYDKIVVGKPGGHTGLIAQGANTIFRLLDNTSTWHDISTPTVYNTWCHIVGTYTNGVGSSFYKNGVLIGTSPFSTPLSDRGTVLHIGGNVGWNASYSIHGFIDKVGVYNRVLSADEVNQNFQATRGLYGV